MDAQAILDIIELDANNAAKRALHEAQNRVLTIYEESDFRTSQLREDTKKRVELEAAQLADRMGRLADLEVRKDQLAGKRSLISRAFNEALDKLHRLPAEQFGEIILSLIEQNAAGNETLFAGRINDNFFTPAFISKANERLVKLGKPGSLSDSGEKLDNVAGLVLKTPQSELYCTIEALLNDRREALEPSIASILFPHNTL